jgi:hypothetical protein
MSCSEPRHTLLALGPGLALHLDVVDDVAALVLVEVPASTALRLK